MFGGYIAPVNQRYSRASPIAEDAYDSNVNAMNNPSSSTESWRTWYNNITFQWFDPIIQLAQKRAIKESDATTLPLDCDCSRARTRLWAVWSQPEKYTNEHRSLLQAIFEIYGLEYAGIGVYLFISSACTFMGPVLLHKLVLLAEDERTTGECLQIYLMKNFNTHVSVHANRIFLYSCNKRFF